MTHDTWHLTPDTGHLTPNTWHLTPDMQHVVGGKHQRGTNIRIFEYIRIYLDEYIHSSKYLVIFSKANIFGYSFVIYLCWQIYSDIHSSNIYDSEYIWIFIVSQKGKKLLLLVETGSIWFQNNKKYENGQNSPKQSWENYLIFKYIRISWTNIFICRNIRWFFMGKFIRIFIHDIFIVPKIFGYSFVQYLW